MTSDHTDVGAYALGLLEPADQAAFESHLAGCATCASELAELSGMRDLLTGVEPAHTAAAELDAAQITSLVHRRARAQRRKLRWQAALGAAACAALAAGGVATGLLAGGGQSGQPAVLSRVVGVRHTATNPQTGATATVGLAAKAWGTQITLDLGKVRGPLECQLVAVTATGQRRVVAGWFVPPAGYGVPGHPAHLVVAGGTSIPPKGLSQFVVTVKGGGTLVTIPV
jgi:putative zinc finger protein